MRYSLLFLALFYGFSVAAQEHAIAKVHYVFKHINDTARRDHPLKFEAITYLGNTDSYFTDGSTLNPEESIRKQYLSPNFNGDIVVERTADALRNHYVISPAKEEIFEVTNIAGEYFVTPIEYSAPLWDIQEDTLTIGGYLCQKAVSTFKGRNYSAWFSTELPFSAGPWKLQGLPGLILAAKDDKAEVIFEYAGFEKIEVDGEKILLAPENALPTKAEDVARLQKAFKENPSAYYESRASVRQPSRSKAPRLNQELDPSKIKSISIKNADSYRPSQTTNNPIEIAP